MSAPVVIRSLARALRPECNESNLLTRAAGGDGGAFTELVRRHGPMVLGVCHRVLGPTTDADDAFQTTFLALVENARALHTPTALPGWLHRTAFRAAMKLKARRISPTAPPEPAITAEPLADLSWKEVRAALDEELNALPDDLRAPLVLCYLDGQTRDAAAAVLGVSLSTLKRRLADGLDRLNRRLTRRGVSGLGLVAAALSGSGLTAAVPLTLAQRTGAAFGARTADVVGTMFPLWGWKVTASIVLLVGGLAAGMGLPAHDDPVDPPSSEKKQPAEPEAKARTDADGAPLPDGAVLRLGSTLFRHAGLSDFVLLPDGKSVLSAGSDQQLRTWDLSTGRELRKVPVTTNVKWLDCLSPDGRLAAGFAGKNLVVFDTATGKEKASFLAPGKDFHSTFFSPDGNTLAVLTWEPRLTLVEWSTQKQRELPLPARRIGQDSTFHGYFSTTGKWIVTGGGWGEPICVFDAATGTEKHRLDCAGSRSTLTPDDRTLIVSSWKPNGQKGSELVTFDLTTGREQARFDMGSRQHFYSLDVSPDGKTLACGFTDDSCLVDLGSGRVLRELTGRPIAVTFTRNGKHVIASTGQKLRVWTAATGTELFERPGNLGHLPVLAASPDGKTLTSADWLDKGISVWDLTNGRLVRTQPFRGKEGRYVRNLSFSPDGYTAWAADHEGFVQWWEPTTGKEQRSVQLNIPVTNPPQFTYLYQVRVSSDGKTAAALARQLAQSEKTSCVVWDIASGRVKGERVLPPEQRVWAWTADESTVALSTPDSLIVADGADPSRTRFTISGVEANAPIAFSSDGRLLATRRTTKEEPNAGGVIIVEVTTGAVVAVVKTGKIDRVALADGGRTLVTTGAGALKVFDTTSGAERGRWAVPVQSTALLLAGDTRAITALADGTGLVWDLTAFPVRAKVSADTPTKLWDTLAGKDSPATHKAAWELVDRPAEALDLIRDKLKPTRPADEVTVRKLISKLDDTDFVERESATKALQALSTAAAPALRSALKADPSAERADRIKRLLAALNAPVVPAGDNLRELRAVAILERIGTAEARKVLDTLTGGIPDARLTVEAAAAVTRLKAQSK
ncbi:wd-40 repeat : Uncultured bacterium genome assembly Metasoil_fosmids_resub OS=uncultured bacterium PE=4 SV=1: Sigma70_r2: Sigma70_r4_2 [Gemmata massiliana]|uniref:ECF RNA polymerase sigma factor SigE n=1 Tax=Gemmata massiliana TaxID=1210884 RepID=A0A6P2CXG0_9BACT|nr:sigma-70 family RNA polymerase sigma factor [Gemmata massiliana]VTR93808.1 wd-40 repeat : Uncultured bacterium genome assembly Metasoil_fosmids_resub OS=uncultured bacterium PE=4 SV=1: Sigma70_r2: Sigma70_r4_2 [Gemmata massiliana]